MYQIFNHWTNCGPIAENIQNVPNFQLLGTLWSNVVCPHNILTMCPLGIWVLVPSVKD